jgi:hypothetical protein
VAAYFVDASALAKRYFAETGSAWVRALLDPTTDCTVYVVRTTAVEMIAAISRRERGGSLTPVDAATARAAFQADIANEYQVLELTESVAQRSMSAAETHGLRGYDSVQLGAALELNARRSAAGMSTLVFVSADAELNSAAMAEGLTVDNPNSHP